MFELRCVTSHGFVVMVYKAFGEEMGILAQNLPPGPFKKPFGSLLAFWGHWEKGLQMNFRTQVGVL